MGPIVMLAVLLPLIVAMYLLAGFKTVKAGYIEVVFLLGDFYEVWKAGPHVQLLGLQTTERYSAATTQIELPAEERDIDFEGSNPAPGKVKPYRVAHRGMEHAIYYVRKDPNNSNEDPTDPDTYKIVGFEDLPKDERLAMAKDNYYSPLTSEISVAIEYQLKADDPTSVRQFIENVKPGGKRDREQEVRKRMDDLNSYALDAILAKVTLGHFKDNIALFSRLLQQEIEICVGERAKERGEQEREEPDAPWGLHINKVVIKSPSGGKRVNEARADLSVASSAGEALLIKATKGALAAEKDAEGRKKATILDAEGDKAAGLLRNDATKDRLEKLVAAAGGTPEGVDIFRIDREMEGIEKSKLTTLVLGNGSGIVLPTSSSSAP